jgi:hypothetical protein
MINDGTVYLAGPIEGVSEIIAERWRDKAKRILRKYNWVCFDPYLAFTQPPHIEAMPWCAEINKLAISTCEAVLVHLVPTARCFGSIRELQMAMSLGKTVILVDADLYETKNVSAFDCELYPYLENGLAALVGPGYTYEDPRYDPNSEEYGKIVELEEFLTQESEVETLVVPPRPTINDYIDIVDRSVINALENTPFYGVQTGVDPSNIPIMAWGDGKGGIRLEGLTDLEAVKKVMDWADIAYVDPGDVPGSQIPEIDYSKD